MRFLAPALRFDESLDKHLAIHATWKRERIPSLHCAYSGASKHRSLTGGAQIRFTRRQKRSLYKTHDDLDGGQCAQPGRPESFRVLREGTPHKILRRSSSRA